MPYLRLPSGSFVEVPEGMSQSEALAKARQQFPDAFAPPIKPDTGFTGAAKAGFEQLKADYERLKGRTGLKDVEEAEREAQKHEKKSQKIFKPTEESWSEAPFEKFKETLGGSLPYMAAPAAVGLGALALPAALPVGAIAAGGAGLASLGQFTGSNLSRQVAEGRQLKDTDLVAAGAAAVPQAALDVISFRMIPGIGKIFGAAGKEITPEMAKKIAEQNILKTTGAYALQTGKVAGIEGTTEAAQQLLERLQAGLSITDEAARDEYFESFIGGAVLGGTLAVPGTAYRRSQIKSRGAEMEREAQAKKDEATRLAEEQRKASPEYQQELIAQRNDLQGQITQLQEVIKDKRLDPEALKEGKEQIKELQKQLSTVVKDLKEVAPEEAAPKMQGMSIEQIQQERIAAQEAEAEKTRVADEAKTTEKQFVQRHQALSTNVDTLTTQLQDAMKNGDVATAEKLGATLDQANAELSQLTDTAQRAGINVFTTDTQLKNAQKALSQAQVNLAKASENDKIVLDPQKRAELFQAIKDAETNIATLKEQKKKEDASAELATKQVGTEVVSAEETEQPFDMEEYQRRIQEPSNQKMLRYATEVTTYKRAFVPENPELDTLVKDIDEKKLSNASAKLLGLPTQAGKAKWSFDTATKKNEKLSQAVAKQLADIEDAEKYSKLYNMGLPEDPRTPYLVQIAEGLGVSKQKAPKSKVDLGRNLRGQVDLLPAAQKLLGKNAPIAEYTPAHLAKIRTELAEINKVLSYDENYNEERSKNLKDLTSKISRLKKRIAKKGISEADKKGSQEVLARYEAAKEQLKKTERLTPGSKERLSRRKARLEQEIEDATLPLRFKGKAPQSLKIESDIETLENQLKVTTTPSQIKKLTQRIQNAQARLAKVTKTSRLPEGGAKGEQVIPARKESEALFEIQEAIDQLRKGEFFGGAAGKEKSLESQSRTLVLKGIRSDVDTLINAAIADINIGRRSFDDPDMSAQEKEEFSNVVRQLLLTKAARATGWRAELQRTPKTEEETAIAQAFKAAGFDFADKTAQEQYLDALEKSNITEENIVENYGEANKQIEKLRFNLDTALDNQSEITDNYLEATEPSIIETYKKQKDRADKEVIAARNAYEKAKAEFVTGEKEGKGEIRTGMREEERIDIKDFISNLKQKYGAERARFIEPREVTSEKMPEIEGEPKELKALREEAFSILEENKGLLRGLAEVLEIFTPAEVRKSKQIFDNFSKFKTSALDFIRDINSGEENKDSFFNKVIVATEKEKEAGAKNVDALVLEQQVYDAEQADAKAVKEGKRVSKGDKLINDSLRRKADKLRKQANALRQEADALQKDISNDVNKVLENVKQTISTAETAAKQRLDTEFKNFFNQIKDNNAEYIKKSKEYQVARNAFYKEREKQIGAARAKEEGDDRARTVKAIKKGEAEGRQKVGLGLPGKKVESEIQQVAVSNLVFGNMLKKVGALHKLYVAAYKEQTGDKFKSENERTQAKEKALREYRASAKNMRAYGEEEGLGADVNSLTDLYITLASFDPKSQEYTKWKEKINTKIKLLDEQAMRISTTKRFKKEVGPEGSIEREEKLKAIQSEQTEETKRKIARRANVVTQKQRDAMREKVQKELDAHLSKKRPEGDTKTAINARKRYDNTQLGLEAQLRVIEGADFDILRNRGNIKREAEDNRYRPTAGIQRELDEHLAKKRPEGDTKTAISARKKYDDRTAELKKKLEFVRNLPIKGVQATGEEGVLTAAAAAKERDTRIKEFKMQEPLTEEEKFAKTPAGKRQEQRIGFAKGRAKEKILSDDFEKALKGLNYEAEGIKRAGLTPKEYEALIKRAENQKVNAWENEASDAGIDLGDFSGLHEGMRGDWDPRIEKPITGEGVDQYAAQKHIDSKKLPKGLMVMTLARLTPTLRGMAAKQGLTEEQIDGIRGGVLPNGVVFFVSENHADLKDLDRTIAHEITGHLGVEGVLGQDGMNALSKQVAKQKGGVFGLADKLGVSEEASAAYMAAKLSGKSEEFALAKALREVIAHVAETRPDKTFLQKANEFIKALVGAMRAALRKMNINLDIDTSDVYKLLRAARKSEKIGPGAYVGRDGEIQFSTGGAVYGADSGFFSAAKDKVLTKEQTWKEKYLPFNLGLVFNQKYINQSAGLERVFENKGVKNSLSALSTKYAIGMHAQRYTWSGQAMANGVPKLRKESGGKGYVLESIKGANLKDLAKTLGDIKWGNAEGNRNTYSMYRIALRAERVGYDKLNFDKPDEMKLILKQVLAKVNNTPALRNGFAKADKIYNQYNRDLMDLLVQTGAIPKEQANELVKYDDYVPYYRKEADGTIYLDIGGAKRVRVGNVKEQPYLNELTGGNERIVDIYTGAIQNTTLLIDKALSNLASRNTAFALAELGLVETKGKTGTGIRMGYGGASDKIIRFNVQPDEKYDKKDKKGNVIEKDDGRRHVIVNTESAGVPAEFVVKGLAGVNTSVPALVKAMGMPARLLRSWVTRNPVYAARQVVRDPFIAVMASGVDTLPVLTSLKQMAKTMPQVVRGENVGSEVERLGIVSSNVFTGTIEDREKLLLQLTSGKSGWETLLARADALAMQGDASTRQIAFNNFRKQGLSEMEAIIATHELMPFSQRGTSASLFLLSTMVPFLNAQIQGLNVLYRAFTGKGTFQDKLRIKQKLWQRGMLMFGMSMAYAILMSDDEAYQNANDDERYNNWFVYVPGVDEPVRVPIPFELGIVFKALPEAIVNVARGDKSAEEAFVALGKMIKNSVPLGPSSIPQAIKAPIEVLADYSFYTGRSILGERLKDVDPSERFNQNTTEVAKLIGKVTGKIPVLGEYLSPVQIEYLLRGYTGSLPLALASLTNPVFGGGGTGGEKPEMRASDLPVFGSVFQPKDAGGLINRAYKDMQSVVKAKETYNKLEEEGREKDAEAYADQFADILDLAPLAGQFRQRMGELAKEEREVKSDRNMSGEEKRRLLDEIRQERIELSKEFIAEKRG
jgi:hypothetical protein